VEFEKTPVSTFGAGVAVSPAPPPAAGHDPQGTLVSSQNEADELRRRIANPGIPEEEVEMDLEELDEVADPTHARLVPEALAPPPPSPPAPAPPTPAPPAPAADSPAGRATEVEVPIDIEVAPGTTRISLNLRLVLNLKPR
jgi:hypothetical protein